MNAANMRISDQSINTSNTLHTNILNVYAHKYKHTRTHRVKDRLNERCKLATPVGGASMANKYFASMSEQR